MKVDLILKKVLEIKETVGGDCDILALDWENNPYDFKDIIYHEGLKVYGIKFE